MRKFLLLIEGASVFIPGQRERMLALKDINLELRPGEHLAISGLNGSGKSTLLRLIHGELWPCSGSLTWASPDGALESSRIVARKLTALVSPQKQERLQQLALWQKTGDWLLQDSVLDPLPEDSGDLESQARVWLERLGSEEIWNKSIASLSQGQLRICLLARAFLRKPSLLLLDEYADGLDAAHLKLAKGCLEELRQTMSMIVVSHRESNIPAFISRKMNLVHGRLHEGAPIFKNRSPQIQALPGLKPAGSHSEATVPQLGQNPLFEARNATVYMGAKPVLKDISWSCAQGGHWLIKGGNGAGKSTFLRMLAGDEFVAAGGFCQIWNPAIGRLARSLEEKRRLVSLLSDQLQACYAYDMSALDLVCTGFDNSIGVYREYRREEKLLALETIAWFFPDDDFHRLAQISIRRLSSGQLRRLFLARALVSRPCALLLDEPFSLLDCASREKIGGLLQKLGREGWKNSYPAIIFVSHNEEDAPFSSYREAELRNGELHILK